VLELLFTQESVFLPEAPLDLVLARMSSSDDVIFVVADVVLLQCWP